MNQNSKMLIGAAVAAALAVAVYYGLLSPQQAHNIQGQADQTLGTSPASQLSNQPPAQGTQTAPATPSPAPASH